MSKTPKTDVAGLLATLASRESEFLAQEFLAPVVPDAAVQVRIGGVLCKIRTEPSDFEGWGVFQPASTTSARLVRAANLAQRRRYLDLLPLVRLIACRRQGPAWLACAAHTGDVRIRVEGFVPVRLAEEVQAFDLLKCRFDGGQFWFDEVDPHHDPRLALHLRTSLLQSLPPESIPRPGLTAQERAAYEALYWQQVQPKERRRHVSATQPSAAGSDPTSALLSASLSHAGAELIDYLERGDVYQVTFDVDGQRHVSSVDKRDLTVQSSGICLSGRDRDFDLTSLVGVLREERW